MNRHQPQTNLNREALNHPRVGPVLNVMSVDLECWEQLVYRRLTGRTIQCSENVIEATNRLLEIFEAKGIKATFFVLGNIAEAFPELVKSIHGLGHEIATHGYSHTVLDRMAPPQFREEIRKSVSLLESITREKVIGFRAPEFSLSQSMSWAIESLAAEGIRYDSSILPTGNAYPPASERTIPKLSAGKSIIEIPPSTVSFLTHRILTGGSYFRLMPYPLMRRLLRTINNKGFPFVFYCHPYEFSPSALRVPDNGGSGMKVFKTECKYNLLLRRVPRKFTALLTEFKFASFKEVLAHELSV
ncbi:polysaccharide deacetylase family protein [Desulfomonile tiedjei]|uniref:Putative xylanase/chitin deacetylase n=1 Tax=Desulfomonile tiedjei (strain ATCC 49306 / DSM 6799 / DCB-1) TaxID=706587 RepID=I4C7E3_DESTA|nr:polysaccharide deacetylase family protein [Desulfomonile tiedjei]AFM25484.1 putative xylanase/chitin deacetylase [Desulfomonile tiedjei DSM 6799]